MERTEAVIMREFRTAYCLLANNGHLTCRETTEEEAARHRVTLREWLDELALECGRMVTEREAHDAL